MPRRPAATLLVALAAGLALADASIVALALPPILHQLSTSVAGVAAVVGVYTAVLAIGLLPAARLARVVGADVVGAGGLALFAVASIVCGAAGSLPVLLVARGFQAAGAAAGLVAAFDAIDAGGRGRRLWVAAAVFGAAAGPAVGGVLTQAIDWRAIFIAQAPVAAAAAVVLWRVRDAPPAPAAEPRERFALGPALSLALVAGALTAVLFLLVLELVAGWSVEPLGAAVALSVLPVAALATARRGGSPHVRAATGCVLVAVGALSLAFLPGASLLWTLPPQVLAGAGMGLALPALAGELLPERTAQQAARLLTARHAGIVAALLVLAPVTTAQLDDATHTAQLRGVALVLDANLPPQDKLQLAPALLGGVSAEQPRAALQRAIDDQRSAYSDGERAAFDRLAQRTDDTLVTAVGSAFRDAFLIAAAFALAAAVALVASAPRRVALERLVPASATLALVAVYLALHAALAPAAVPIRDPCQPRQLPNAGGLLGDIQGVALQALDRAACHYGSSREELVLALSDDAEARRFAAAHGVDPRTVGGLLQGLLG